MEQQGISQEEAAYQLTSGGLRIYAAVDLDLQQTLETMMEDDSEDGYFPALWRYEAIATDIPAGSEIAYDDAGLPLDADGSAVFAAGDTPARNADGTLRTGQGDGGTVEFYRALRTQAAAVTLDYDGHVLALVGGVGPKTVDLAYNRATAPHQTGSTMKPLAAYALGIEYGLINFSSPMTDAPLYTAADKRILNTDLVQRLGLPNDPYAAVNLARDDVWRSWPNNYSGTPSGQTVTVASALAQSLNTIPVQLGSLLGTDRMLGFLQDWLGISTLDPESDNALAPLVLGSQTNGISPLELAAAYAVFNEGVYTPPALYTQVQDREGDLLLDRQGQRYARQAISPQTATIMNCLLQGVLTAPNGTARGRAPEGGMPAAAKTGTTTDYRDFTFVGLMPYYVTAGWWGFVSDLGGDQRPPAAIPLAGLHDAGPAGPALPGLCPGRGRHRPPVRPRHRAAGPLRRRDRLLHPGQPAPVTEYEKVPRPGRQAAGIFAGRLRAGRSAPAGRRQRKQRPSPAGQGTAAVLYTGCAVLRGRAAYRHSHRMS